MENKRKVTMITAGIILVLVAVITTIVVTRPKELKVDSLNGLISTSYNVQELITKDDIVDIKINGNLTEEEFEGLVKEIRNKVIENNMKDHILNIVLVSEDKAILDEFYFDGLSYRAKVNLKENIGEIITYQETKEESGQSFGNITNEQVGTVNDLLQISMETDSEQELVSKTKGFIEAFKEANKDKNLKPIQVSVKAKKTGVELNEKYENIVGVIKYINF